MPHLHSITIENFKVFKEPITIPLDNPTVLIGPNNSGKTTVLQALALWSLAIKKIYNLRGTEEFEFNDYEPAIILQKSDLLQIPVLKNTSLWAKNNNKKEIVISVDIQLQDVTNTFKLIFQSIEDDRIYVWFGELNIFEITEQIASTQIDILYPLSGLSLKEEYILPGAIRVNLGQGRTGNTLRNLCFTLFEIESGKYWKRTNELMQKLWQVQLTQPQVDHSEGTIVLSYLKPNDKTVYELTSAGRGQLQFLWLLVFFYTHQNSVILIDEPDAHLEILRQKQIFTVLKDVAKETNCQVIITTHSEVILNEALETNLVFLFEGKVENLANKKPVKEVLKEYGAEHYIKARQMRRILYLEGSTDFEILRAFARNLNHSVVTCFDNKLYYYYTQDPNKEQTIFDKMDSLSGSYRKHRTHYSSIKQLTPELKGVGVFDSDGKNSQDENEKDLKVLYWRRYEIENYFLTPELLRKYIAQKDAPILEIFEQVLSDTLLAFIFKNNQKDFETYQSSKDAQRLLFTLAANNVKLSAWAEETFERLTKKINADKPLLRKGDFYQLIDLMEPEDIDPEVVEKLDAIYECLSSANLETPNE